MHFLFVDWFGDFKMGGKQTDTLTISKQHVGFILHKPLFSDLTKILAGKRIRLNEDVLQARYRNVREAL